ncbi:MULTISPECIES: UrcA family protein [Henriciella]|jgi:UrcA family protein|uniref:UrcA family protein n=1 Tax=Henriciella pelagia TaxID=1977912 RepID=A0ABQ1JAB7_9PROT|nr:UrcA family protein [Henriciella pelagia]GGB61506.1 hypothetical protein GCM10011503_07610 [Henriciella pelagia]
MFSKKLAIVSFFAASALAVSPALAAGAKDTKSAEVDISGFDLTTDDGSKVVIHRLERAAKKVCGARSGPQSIAERNAINRCIDDAMNNALESLTAARERQAALKNTDVG